MTARPNDVTPSPALARLKPPPKMASKSSTRLTVTSGICSSSPRHAWARAARPFHDLRLLADHEHSGPSNPTVTHVIQRTVGIGKRIGLDLGPHRHRLRKRQELLAIEAGEVGHGPNRSLVPE